MTTAAIQRFRRIFEANLDLVLANIALLWKAYPAAAAQLESQRSNLYAILDRARRVVRHPIWFPFHIVSVLLKIRQYTARWTRISRKLAANPPSPNADALSCAPSPLQSTASIMSTPSIPSIFSFSFRLSSPLRVEPSSLRPGLIQERRMARNLPEPAPPLVLVPLPDRRPSTRTDARHRGRPSIAQPEVPISEPFWLRNLDLLQFKILLDAVLTAQNLIIAIDRSGDPILMQEIHRLSEVIDDAINCSKDSPDPNDSGGQSLPPIPPLAGGTQGGKSSSDPSDRTDPSSTSNPELSASHSPTPPP